MFKIIGGDRKEYGPVTTEEVRRWIAEGRLNGQSMAQAEGRTDWQPLSAFAEFGDALRLQTNPVLAPTATGAAMPPPIFQEWQAQILARQPQLRVGQCFSQGWELLKANFGLLFGACAVVWLITTVCERVPLLSSVLWVFLGIFYGGLYFVFLKRLRGQPAVIADVFAGFSMAFVQLLLVGLVAGILTGLGMCCLLLPGIYLVVAWIFAVPLVIDKRLEFWTAMELSRKIVTRCWFEVFVLLVLPFIPLLVVGVIGGVHIASTIVPVIRDMISSGAPDLQRIMDLSVRLATTGLPVWVATKFVFLLTLPIVMAARAVAYENLFGARATSGT
jgi:hypothetical protein